MKVFIIEDEPPALKRLQKMLQELRPDIEITGSADTIEDAIEWLSKHQHPDLILSDIHLADGLSFDIFSSIETKCPVIFITAFDQYAINAFKVNSVDYLLKPVKRDELEKSILKYENIYSKSESKSIDYNQIAKLLQKDTDGKQKRIVVKYGQNIKAIEIEKVAYFFTENKIVFLTTFDKQRLAVDFNLDQLEEMLEPGKFFRINRQFIINIDAIDQMFAYSKSRVKIKLNPPSEMETVVSVERSPHFKKWLTGLSE